MTFTSAGRFFAVFAIILAVFRISVAVYVVSTNPPEVAARHVLGPGSSGQIIDEAIWVIIGAIIVGILTDISRAVQSK